MKTIHSMLAGTIAVLLVSGAWAQELGGDAASLDGLNFVKGDKVGAFKDDTVYVVEFWATWCPPCLTSIPHLTELQKRFKDKVVMIGISNETEAKVKPFVEKMGDKMGYTVAVDAKRKVSAGYMQAFKVRGIPHAFIVKGGKIAWHGHPMNGMDKALERFTGGAAVATITVGAGGAKKSEAVDVVALMTAYMAKVRGDNALGAREIGEKVLEHLDDPNVLNEFGWALLTDKKIKHRDLDLAVKIAQSAYLRSNGKVAAVADTYARAVFEKGLADAQKLQRKAIELNRDGNADLQSELKRVLKTYEGFSKEL